MNHIDDEVLQHRRKHGSAHRGLAAGPGGLCQRGELPPLRAPRTMYRTQLKRVPAETGAYAQGRPGSKVKPMGHLSGPPMLSPSAGLSVLQPYRASVLQAIAQAEGSYGGSGSYGSMLDNFLDSNVRSTFPVGTETCARRWEQCGPPSLSFAGPACCTAGSDCTQVCSTPLDQCPANAFQGLGPQWP